MSEPSRLAMTAPKISPVLATHGGKFYCDEVFAYVVLKLAPAPRFRMFLSNTRPRTVKATRHRPVRSRLRSGSRSSRFSSIGR